MQVVIMISNTRMCLHVHAIDTTCTYHAFQFAYPFPQHSILIYSKITSPPYELHYMLLIGQSDIRKLRKFRRAYETREELLLELNIGRFVSS
jgi:hypothetical protein